MGTSLAAAFLLLAASAASAMPTAPSSTADTVAAAAAAASTTTPTPSAVEAAVRHVAAEEYEDNAITSDTTATEVIEGNETTPVDSQQRDSDKERRIQEIKGYIYNTTRPRKLGSNLSGPSTIVDSRILNGLVQKMPTVTSSGEYPKMFTSFHPVCSVSHNKKVEAAKNSDDMFMMFNLTYPVPVAGYELAIISAKLRLYKVAQSNGTGIEDACISNKQQAIKSTPAAPNSTSDEPTTPTPSASTSSTTPSATTTQPTVINLYPEAKDVWVRVTISYLIRQPKKNNKLARNILDSKMVSMSGDGWVEFNVSNAVRTWRNSSNNLGLFVEVEDLERKKQSASKFFREMNCSKETADTKPIPSVLFDAALANDNHTSPDHLRPYMLPVISLCTAEISTIEVNIPNNFLALRASDSEEFRKIIISYSNHKLDHHRDLKPPAGEVAAAVAEDEQVVDEQVQNTEEHHPRHHRNRHHHNHQHHNHHHHNQQQQREDDLFAKQVRELARDALRHKGRNNNNLFHSGGHRKHEEEKHDEAQQVEVIILPVVLQSSKVAEMDDDIQEMEQQPIAIDKLFQRGGLLSDAAAIDEKLHMEEVIHGVYRL